MKINTKVVFEWNDDTKQYEEIYCESYDYDGEVDKCQEAAQVAHTKSARSMYMLESNEGDLSIRSDRRRFVNWAFDQLKDRNIWDIGSDFWHTQNIERQWQSYISNPNFYMWGNAYMEGDELIDDVSYADVWSHKVHIAALKWIDAAAEDQATAEEEARSANEGLADTARLVEEDRLAEEGSEEGSEELVIESTTAASGKLFTSSRKFKDRVFGSHPDPSIIAKFKQLQGGNFRLGPNDEVKSKFQDYLGDRTPFVRMWSAVLISKAGAEPEILYNVINENRNKSYDMNESIEGSKIVPELMTNPYLKPEAGITSVTSKTEGALGAIKRTTVNFVVHNKTDFENIFLPFFMKPGATVIVDFGWSDSSFDLYNIEDRITLDNTDMSTFKKWIYGTPKEPGFIKKDKKNGLIEVIIGNVTSYQSTITSVGSFECSIELVSQNATLLDTGISEDNSLKFMFDNKLEEVLINLITHPSDFENEDARRTLVSHRYQYSQFSAEQRKTNFEAFYKSSKIGVSGTDAISPLALKAGIFYRDISPTTSSNIIDDKGLLYIAWGLFEDLFLNGLIAKSKIRRDKKYDINYNTNESFVRYEKNLVDKQIALFKSKEPLPLFLLPDDWRDTSNGITSQAEFDAAKDGGIADYAGVPVIPFRDVFVSMDLISNTFNRKQNVNEALESIFDTLSEESANVWKLKMIATNDSWSSLSIQDFNLTKVDSKANIPTLKFDVFTENSIITNLNYNFDMPKGGLANAIAFGAVPGVNFNQDKEKDAQSFLKLIVHKMSSAFGDHTHATSLPTPLSDKSEEESMPDISSISFKKIEDITKSPLFKTSNREGITKAWDGVNNWLTIKSMALEVQNYIFDQAGSQEGKNPNKKYTSTLTDMYNAKARQDTLLSSKNTSIAPMLPFTINPTIYGNTYLHVGDLFTVNFLPKPVINRVMFMIIGIEHKIGGATWETTYSTVMRLKPNAKGDSAASIDINFDYLSRPGLPDYDRLYGNLHPVGTQVVKITSGNISAFQTTLNFSGGQGQIVETPTKKIKVADSRLAVTTFEQPQTREDAALAIAFQKTIIDYINAGHVNEKNILVYLTINSNDEIEIKEEDAKSNDLIMKAYVKDENPQALKDTPVDALWSYFDPFMQLLGKEKTKEWLALYGNTKSPPGTEAELKSELKKRTKTLLAKQIGKGQHDEGTSFNIPVYTAYEEGEDVKNFGSNKEGKLRAKHITKTPIQKIDKEFGIMVTEYKFKCGEYPGSTKKSGVTNPIGHKYIITFKAAGLTGKIIEMHIPRWLIDPVGGVLDYKRTADHYVIIARDGAGEAKSVKAGKPVYYRRMADIGVQYYDPKAEKWIDSLWFDRHEPKYRYPHEGFARQTGTYIENPNITGTEAEPQWRQHVPLFPSGLDAFATALSKNYKNTKDALYLKKLTEEAAADIKTIIKTDKATEAARFSPEKAGIAYLESEDFNPRGYGKMTKQPFNYPHYQFDASGQTVYYEFNWFWDNVIEDRVWQWKYVANEGSWLSPLWLGSQWYDTTRYPTNKGNKGNSKWLKITPQPTDHSFWKSFPVDVGSFMGGLKGIKQATTHIRILNDIMHGIPYTKSKKGWRYPPWYVESDPALQYIAM